MNFAKYPD